MRRRVLRFNPEVFIHMDFTHFNINCFAITFVNHLKSNPSLLRVSVHNTLIHILYSIINFVPYGYDTRLIVYITCVLSILVERTYYLVCCLPATLDKIVKWVMALVTFYTS